MTHSSFALWRDRTGVFSWPRTFALALAVAPALPLLARILAQDLGARPLTEVSHVTGLWAIRLLAATLAVSPLIALLRRPRLAPARRILGVAVFAWMVAHFAAFVADKMFDPVVVAREIALRVYLLIGMIAFLMLGALAATSTDGMIARLGATRWRNLHLLVYPVAILGLAHYFMQSKQDVSEPTALAGVFALLGLIRLAKRFGAQATPLSTAALAVAAALGTALAEAIYFMLKFGAPFTAALEADIDFSYDVRPCWLPLAVGLAMALAGLAFRQKESARRPAKPRTAPEAARG
jgi:sulfoxide reductase heme-binding subunit YedZ